FPFLATSPTLIFTLSLHDALPIFEIYAYAFRKIAREAASSKDTDHRRFDPKSLVWRRESDGIHLSKLTPDAVTAWKSTVVAEARSEEHTSELQSRFDLVCRLLLEK